MDSIGKICILGSGTWATALAKIILCKEKSINWYIRKDDQIDEFYKLGHNPNYLTNVEFNLSQITFYSNIEKAIKASNTIIIAIPSPFVKPQIKKVWSSSFKDKFVISSVKGVIPGINMLISEYLADNFKIPENNIGVISGPCHAEEVALGRLSFLTVASKDSKKAELMANAISSRIIKTSISNDVTGIELAAVIKNIYAIAVGICHGMNYGDNFQAVLMANCAREMSALLDAVSPIKRNICEQHYLGDMLVTGYSQFSRNRTFGTMIGKGYSVKSAQLEMEMIAEGYYGAKCIQEMNKFYKVNIPIINTVHDILYQKLSPQKGIITFIENFI